MADAAAPETPPTPAPESDAAPAPEQVAAEQPATAPSDAVPEWQQKVKQANSQAAADRQKARKAADDAAAATKTAEELAAQVAELQGQVLRSGLANELGIPADLAMILPGKDRDEVLANAQKIIDYATAKADPAKPAKTRPVESLQPGSGAAQSGPAQLSREDIRHMAPEAVVAAKAAGQLNDLLGIGTR